MEGIIVLLYLYAWIIGICVASFINVVIWRVPQGLSIAKGRSYCPACHHTLAWYDLFPIFSYLFLKGKCRYCHASIPMRDTLIEALGGFLAILCFHHYGFTWDTIVVFALFMVLLAITMIDFDTMLIPNGLIIALIPLALVMTLLHLDIDLWQRVIGFFIISLPMYLMTLAIPDCFGGGDIKLMVVTGFLLGWKLVALAAFLGVMVCGVYGIWLFLTKKAKKGVHIAFGPYLCLGIMVSLLYGNQLLELYLSLFGLI